MNLYFILYHHGKIKYYRKVTAEDFITDDMMVVVQDIGRCSVKNNLEYFKDYNGDINAIPNRWIIDLNIDGPDYSFSNRFFKTIKNELRIKLRNDIIDDLI